MIQLYRSGYLDEAQQDRDISEYAYKRGAASLLDFLDAERSYRATQLAYRQSLAAYLLALEQLAKRWERGDCHERLQVQLTADAHARRRRGTCVRMRARGLQLEPERERDDVVFLEGVEIGDAAAFHDSRRTRCRTCRW